MTPLRSIAALTLILALAACAASSLVPVAFVIDGRVAQIEDGDTIAIAAPNGATVVIRMSDYDSPEIAHRAFRRRDGTAVPYRPGQPGGKAAAAALLGTRTMRWSGKVGGRDDEA